jgi:hypothetical protein
MEERPFSDTSYNQYLKEEKLMGTRCKSCGELFLPPRPICIKCHQSSMQWIEFQGTGKLAAFTCIAVGPPFITAEGYGRKNPYCVGVVELNEGVRVDARIEGIDTTKPDELKVNTPMKVKYLHRGEGESKRTYLGFTPA